MKKKKKAKRHMKKKVLIDIGCDDRYCADAKLRIIKCKFVTLGKGLPINKKSLKKKTCPHLYVHEDCGFECLLFESGAELEEERKEYYDDEGWLQSPYLRPIRCEECKQAEKRFKRFEKRKGKK